MDVVVPKHKTVADYERLPEGAPYQLIEGELVMTPSPTPTHQIVSGRLEYALMTFVLQHDLGLVLYAPIDIVLSETNVFQPDIIFISKDRSRIIGEKNIQGAPDLVVEILSPSTAYYDLKSKRAMYERSGVREYWIVDPQMQTIEVYESREGRFSLATESRAGGRATSCILDGFSVELASLFE